MDIHSGLKMLPINVKRRDLLTISYPLAEMYFCHFFLTMRADCFIVIWIIRCSGETVFL